MGPLNRIRRQRTENSEKLNALLMQETELDEQQREEMATLHTRAEHLGREYLAALAVDGPMETGDEILPVSKEDLQRLQLRSEAKLTNYMLAHAQGRMNSGAELELQQEAQVNGIPAELFDVAHRTTRAESLAPTTGTGVNVDPIRPQIFARSVMPRLGVAMPRVQSGSYSTMTVTTALTAAAIAAGGEYTAGAAVLTPQTTRNHRVTGRLSLRVEDIQHIGVDNFESILRQNLMLVMSDELDKLGLTGDNVDPNPHGLYPQLTDPGTVSVDVTWPLFVAAMASGIDGGPWAETMMQCTLLTNAETMRVAESTFQRGTGNQATPGDISAAAYLRERSAGFFSSRRMPATVSDVAGCILYRAGTMGLDGVNAVRTAVCPMWNEISIDDIFSDSASGIHHYTMHSLVGDVIIEQANAYTPRQLEGFLEGPVWQITHTSTGT